MYSSFNAKQAIYKTRRFTVMQVRENVCLSTTAGSTPSYCDVPRFEFPVRWLPINILLSTDFWIRHVLPSDLTLELLARGLWLALLLLSTLALWTRLTCPTNKLELWAGWRRKVVLDVQDVLQSHSITISFRKMENNSYGRLISPIGRLPIA